MNLKPILNRSLNHKLNLDASLHLNLTLYHLNRSLILKLNGNLIIPPCPLQTHYEQKKRRRCIVKLTSHHPPLKNGGDAPLAVRPLCEKRWRGDPPHQSNPMPKNGRSRRLLPYQGRYKEIYRIISYNYFVSGLFPTFSGIWEPEKCKLFCFGSIFDLFRNLGTREV